MAKQGISEADAPIVKGMLLRGDKSHDIAAWFGVNAGRVAEIKYGRKHPNAVAAPEHSLPPQGAPSYFTPRPDMSADEKLQQALAGFDLKWSRELAVSAHERRQTNEKLDMLIRQLLELRVLLKVVDRTAPKPSRRHLDAA